jgi:hypothetical protein
VDAYVAGKASRESDMPSAIEIPTINTEPTSRTFESTAAGTGVTAPVDPAATLAAVGAEPEADSNDIQSSQASENPPAAPAADGPVTNLLSFAAGVGVDDAFANLGVPYGSTETPSDAYVTFLAGVGVDDVFANAAGVGAVAGIGDPVAILGDAGDNVVAGSASIGSGSPLDNGLTNLSLLDGQGLGVGVDDVFANVGVPYGSTATPSDAYVTFLAGVGVDDVFANAAGVGAVAGIGDPVAILGHVGDDVVAAIGPTLAGGTTAAQFQFPALGGTGTDSLVGEVGQLPGVSAGDGGIAPLPVLAGADSPVLAAIGEPAADDGLHILDTPLQHGPLL